MRFLSIILLLFVFAINSNAESKFGITGGTKGVGFKYSFTIYKNIIGVDLGFPFYYSYDKRTGDTIEFNHYFGLNAYAAVSAKVYNKDNNEFDLGLSMLPTFAYKYKVDTDKRDFNLENTFSFFIQYVRNNENGKFMSFELFPFSFVFEKDFISSLSPNVQISIYLSNKKG
jgi:hypothetical protein